MEWLNWLDKKIDISELTEDTPEQKKLAKEIADDDNEDHKQQFTPTLDPKEASWESWLEKNDDEYHSVMNDVTNERKGSKYDKNTKQWTNPIGMPSRQHCGATSTSLANRGHGKKVSGKYHGTWDGKPEDHSWVENKDGHIIDASRDQFHGDKEQGIKTIKQDHPDYSKYKKNPNCPSCGTDKSPTKFTNLRTRCTGDNCNHFGDEAPEIFEKHHGRKHRDSKELGTFRNEAESQSNALHGIGKSWESWLDKNNGIETDHKNDKKEEWDGKFSSSTIEDEVKDDEDDKAVSEEEPLDELTDGKLEEIEKLKSWESWLEKDALTNAWIETITKKPKNNAMEDSQNYSRQSTGARYNYDNRSKRSNKPKYSKLGDVGDVKGDTILTNEGEETGKFSKNHNVGGSKSNALADSSKKRQQVAVGSVPTPRTGKSPTGVGKAWEAWLEKNEKWDKQEKDNDKKSKINRTGKIGKKDAKDIVRRTYDGQTPNKFMQQVNSNMAADEEKQSGSKHRGDKRIPLTRVRTHTNQPLRLGGVAEDTPIGASHQSDHQLRTGRKEQYIEPKNADLWKTWLEKDALDGKQGIDKLPKSSIKPILTEAQEVINRDDRGKKNDMYKSWLEKMQGAGDARFGNQHLTGLDQEPVDNEEDEANILPAKDVNSNENDEKQEETEDKDAKDNKPYKALSHE